MVDEAQTNQFLLMTNISVSRPISLCRSNKKKPRKENSICAFTAFCITLFFPIRKFTIRFDEVVGDKIVFCEQFIMAFSCIPIKFGVLYVCFIETNCHLFRKMNSD